MSNSGERYRSMRKRRYVAVEQRQGTADPVTRLNQKPV